MQPPASRPFEILIREYQLGLLAFVRSFIADPAAADDLVQDVFIAAWQQLDDYDKSRPFARWLRGIARNKVLAYLRAAAVAHKHVRVLSPEALDAVAAEFDRLVPGRGDSLSDSLRALQECLATLSADDRDAIRRAYGDQQSCRAIADSLGLSVEAIKKRLQRARTWLRDCILGKLQAESIHV